MAKTSKVAQMVKHAPPKLVGLLGLILGQLMPKT